MKMISQSSSNSVYIKKNLQKHFIIFFLFFQIFLFNFRLQIRQVCQQQKHHLANKRLFTLQTGTKEKQNQRRPM